MLEFLTFPDPKPKYNGLKRELQKYIRQLTDRDYYSSVIEDYNRSDLIATYEYYRNCMRRGQ